MRLVALSDVERQRLAEKRLNYAEVGGTADVLRLPAGYRHVMRQVEVGRGREVFLALGNALLEWRVHMGAGFRLAASSAAAEEGTNVTLGLRLGWWQLRVPCRVVYVINGHTRCGFAYGTVEGHLESGEEAFIAELHEDDSVGFSVMGFSRPATRLVRMGSAIEIGIQDRIIERYLKSAKGLFGTQGCGTRRQA